MADTRLNAVLRVGVATSTPTLPMLFVAELRDLMLLSADSFVENFDKISAYCSTHNRACDAEVYRLLIKKYDVPAEYIDVGVGGAVVVAIAPDASQRQLAEYLEVVAGSLRVAKVFQRVVMSTPPQLFDDARSALTAVDGASYLADLEARVDAQAHTYDVQLQSLRFVVAQSGVLLDNYVSIDRVLMRSALVKATLNYNLTFLKFIWDTFVDPANFRNGDLANDLFMASRGGGKIWGISRSGYRITAFSQVVIDAPNEIFLEEQLAHGETVAWVLNKLLENSLVARQPLLYFVREALEDALRRLREVKGLLGVA